MWSRSWPSGRCARSPFSSSGCATGPNRPTVDQSLLASTADPAVGSPRSLLDSLVTTRVVWWYTPTTLHGGSRSSIGITSWSTESYVRSPKGGRCRFGRRHGTSAGESALSTYPLRSRCWWSKGWEQAGAHSGRGCMPPFGCNPISTRHVSGASHVTAAPRRPNPFGTNGIVRNSLSLPPTGRGNGRRWSCVAHRRLRQSPMIPEPRFSSLERRALNSWTYGGRSDCLGRPYLTVRLMPLSSA